MKIYFFKQVSSSRGWYITNKSPLKGVNYYHCDSGSDVLLLNRKIANTPELKWLHKFIDENYHWLKDTEFGELEI